MPTPGRTRVATARPTCRSHRSRGSAAEVTTELNTEREELYAALRAITRRSAGADVALVFYAGHGIEMDGVNYLLPVDARLARDGAVRYETVPLDDVIATTTGASLRIVILDACRDNPLVRSMQRSLVRRSISHGGCGDLDESLLGDDTLVAYAAEAGETADDGTGKNSPYTAALLAHLEEPLLEISTLFRRASRQVRAATNGQQRPRAYNSLLQDHYLTAGIPASPVSLSVIDVPRLRLIAERGDARAQTELGRRYETGRGVRQDYAEAVRWYRRAAEQGHEDAQEHLGRLRFR